MAEEKKIELAPTGNLNRRISKSSLEGYLLVDNSNCPVPEEVLRIKNLPPEMGRGKLEAAIVTCSHCQRQVILNPGRVRARTTCRKCDKYICDVCAVEYARAGGECRSMNAILDRLQEQAALEEQASARGIILPST